MPQTTAMASRINHCRTFIGDHPSSSDHTALASGTTEHGEFGGGRDDSASGNARLGQRHCQQHILTGTQMVLDLSSDVPGQCEVSPAAACSRTASTKSWLVVTTNAEVPAGNAPPSSLSGSATNYQTVVDTRRRQLWIKIPSPDHFADWTHFDLPELWS